MQLAQSRGALTLANAAHLCSVADLRIHEDQKDQKDQKDNFRPARRPPQAPQACANAAPAPLRGEPLQCSKRANCTGPGVAKQRVAAIGPVFPRFAPGAADRWRMPGAPAAGFGLTVYPTVYPIDSSRAQACSPGRAARSKPQARSAEKQVVPLAPATAPVARSVPACFEHCSGSPVGGCGLGRVAGAHACAQAQNLAIHPAYTGPRVTTPEETISSA